MDVNPYMINLLGYSHEEYLEKKLWEISPFMDGTAKDLFIELQNKGYVRYEHLPVETSEGKRIYVEFVSNSYSVNEGVIIQCNMRDITDRVVLENRQGLIIGMLKLLNGPYMGVETIKSLLEMIQESLGIGAIALRLQEGDDYPYFVYPGFDREFIARENLLCSVGESGCPVLQLDGKPVLDCMCGCVIRGHTDPSMPCFTVGGSFWTNSTTELLKQRGAMLPDNPIRNECNMEGYESVAIVPLRVGAEVLGSLQLNDTRSGVFTEDFMEFIEELAISIAVAVKRVWQEDKIKTLEIAKTRDLLQSSRLLNSGIAHELRTPMQALLNCFELIKEELSASCLCQECKATQPCPFTPILKGKINSVIDLVDDGLERTEYSVKVLNSLSEYSKIASADEVHLINVVPELKTIMRTLMYTDQFKSLGEDRFSLINETGSDAGCFVPINRVDFSQLITNLCRNSREAILHEDPLISIIVSPDSPNIKITVVDNGKGIDKSLGNKIFEPYFSTKENPEGYNQGLGLAMVRDIIAAYGGSIKYNSEPGHTEFIVTLPCEHTD
jgi:PAS domain S-box-containing protein